MDLERAERPRREASEGSLGGGAFLVTESPEQLAVRLNLRTMQCVSPSSPRLERVPGHIRGSPPRMGQETPS